MIKWYGICFAHSSAYGTGRLPTGWLSVTAILSGNVPDVPRCRALPFAGGIPDWRNAFSPRSSEKSLKTRDVSPQSRPVCRDSICGPIPSGLAPGNVRASFSSEPLPGKSISPSFAADGMFPTQDRTVTVQAQSPVLPAQLPEVRGWTFCRQKFLSGLPVTSFHASHDTGQKRTVSR